MTFDTPGGRRREPPAPPPAPRAAPPPVPTPLPPPRPSPPPPTPPGHGRRPWWRKVCSQIAAALTVQFVLVLVGLGVRQILRQPAARTDPPAPTAPQATRTVPHAPPAPDSPDAVLAAHDRLEADLDALLADVDRTLSPVQQDRVRQLRQVHGDRQLLTRLPRWLREAGAADLAPGLRDRLDRLRAEADRLAARSAADR